MDVTPPSATHKSKQRIRQIGLGLCLIIILLLGFRYALKPPILHTLPWSRAVYASDGELLRLSLASDDQYRLWTPLKRTSPRLVEAVLLYEDRCFYLHPGINPIALIRSAFTTLTGHRRQGGSTITMQLARRLYQIDSRTIPGKLTQMTAALWLELRYSKHDILEAYLNLAPYGGNIEGVGAASLIYFRKPAKDLSLPEAIALATIPQNPRRRLVTTDADSALKKARQRLWQEWIHKHPEDARWMADHQLALRAEPRSTLAFNAPHTVDLLLKNDESSPQTNEIRSSIDIRLQRLLERMISDYLRSRLETGIRNASALLVDASTMQVKAAVGSANYSDKTILGQVNGTLAKRSPGSTLKPFIYALALDQGILHPQTLLKDAPTSFGPFSPENFDGRFVGPISAQDALIRSRNVPAVAVAAKLSRPDLYQFLKQANISRMASAEHYGLALVLGGGEVTMEELAQLYAVLANGGTWRPLSYLSTQPKQHAQNLRLLSEEAAFITLDMLEHNIRPDTSAPAQPAIAWKTGTSWGFHDAWTAGVFGRYVLVVWMGNFDGASNPSLIGIEAAAPLFLRIVDAIRAEHLDPGAMVRLQPANLRKVDVCLTSGDFPDHLCPTRTSTWFIAGKSPIHQNTLHRTVWIDRHTGKISCHPIPNADIKVFENWSTDLQRLFAETGLPRRIPHQNEDCSSTSSDEGGPRIASPLRGVTYSIRPSKPEPVMLRADAPGGVNTLFWFVDNGLIGRSRPGETLFWKPAAPRNYTVRVVDDAGRADSRTLMVEYVP